MKYSIICPLCESDDLLPVTLDSFFHINITDYEVIFAADPQSLAAVAVARTICDRYPHVQSQIVVSAATYCLNPKLNNLQKAWLETKGEWILMSDCNVMLPPDAFDRLDERWSKRVGMVCSPPIGSKPSNFVAEIECAYLNTFQAKYQILSDWLGHGFVQGKVMYCNKSQFTELGGIEVLDYEACEDAAATKLVRAAGLQVRLSRKLFDQPLGRRTIQKIWKRQLRWAKLRRVTFPLLYSFEILVTPLPFLFTLFGNHWMMSIVSLCACYTGECCLAKWNGWFLSWRSPFAMIARDFLLLTMWFGGWFGSSIQWSGNELPLYPTATPICTTQHHQRKKTSLRALF